MFEQVEAVVRHYEEVMMELGNPSVAQDAANYRKLMKEQADLEPTVVAYRNYTKANETIAEAVQMLESEKDEEMRNLLKEELQNARDTVSMETEHLKILLLPKDPNDEKNVILEIRSGAGGEEAALFGSDLYRMYCRYAERESWKVEVLEYNGTGLGGISKVTALITGNGAYSKLKFESGTHVVKRIPKTESNGKIQTSTCTVAVMPEADEVEVHLDLNDCRFDVFRATGNGGQCVNTTDSAVRLTHIPTGIVISCQDGKSQLKNRDKALKVLRAKLYDLEQSKAHEKEAAERRSLVGTGARAEKIRTYRYLQSCIIDHRINFTTYRFNDVLDGDLSELISALITREQAIKLAGLDN